jgi:hypothetical protein
MKDLAKHFLPFKNFSYSPRNFFLFHELKITSRGKKIFREEAITIKAKISLKGHHRTFRTVDRNEEEEEEEAMREVKFCVRELCTSVQFKEFRLLGYDAVWFLEEQMIWKNVSHSSIV